MNLKKFIFWILSTIFFLFEFYLRILVGVFQTDLMYYLDLNFKQFSFLSSTIFCLTYGLMQLPVSILLNKLKLKKTILLGITLCSISCFGFYTIKNYKYALLWRLIMGMGSSFGFITLLITIKKMYKKKIYSIFHRFFSIILYNNFSYSSKYNILVSSMRRNRLEKYIFIFRIFWNNFVFYDLVIYSRF